MSVAEFCHWLQQSEFFTDLRESGLPYPIIMSTHLASIAVFGGMILLTDLRLLGWALRSATVTDVVQRFRVWKQVGFVIMVTCGLLLFGAKADNYYGNPYFQIKLSLLVLVGVHAIVFHRSVYGNTEAIDRAPVIPGVAKAAAYLSLALWLGIMSMGRWIAYYEVPGKFITHYVTGTLRAAR